MFLLDAGQLCISLSSLYFILEYWRAFEQFDRNQDGSITKGEVADALRACGVEPKTSWVQEFVAEADRNGELNT